MNQYLETINPKQFTICGVILRPYSLGHQILLKQIESPFVSEIPKEMNLEDGTRIFFLSLLICGSDYKDNIELLNNPVKLKSTVTRFENNLKKLISKNKNWNIYDPISLYKEYIQYFSYIPIFTVETTNDKPASGISFEQSLINIIAKEYGYTEEVILNMSLRKIYSCWCSIAEQNGSIHVDNDDELALIEDFRNRNKAA